MRKSTLTLLLLCITAMAFGQNENIYIEPGLRYGRGLPFDADDSYLWDQPVVGLDLRVGKTTDGSEAWHHWFNYPSYGVALRYEYDYGTVESEAGSPRLGNDIALFAYYDGTIYRGRNFLFDYTLGGGAAWWFFCDAPEVGTQDNRFLGSHLNVHFNLDIGASYSITPNYDIYLRGGVAHSSNAAFKLPDRGVNSTSLVAGVRYHLNEVQIDKTAPKTEEYTRHSIHVADGVGLMESTVDHKYKFCNTFQVGYGYRIGDRIRLGAGFDMMYNPEYKAIFIRNGNEADFTPIKNWSVGSYGSFEALYNRFVFHFAMGGYLYRGCAPDNTIGSYKPYYERLGARFYVDKNKKQFVGITAKLHFGVIDYLEWTYGIQLFNK